MEPNITVAPGITMTPEGGSPVPLLAATVGESSPKAPEIAPVATETKVEPQIQGPEKPIETNPPTGPTEAITEVKAPENKKEEPDKKPKEMNPSEKIRDAKDLGEALKAFAENKGYEKPDLMGDLAAKCAEFGKIEEALTFTKMAVETANSLRNQETQGSMKNAIENLDQSTRRMAGAIEDFGQSGTKIGKALSEFEEATRVISRASNGFQIAADKIATSSRR